MPTLNDRFLASLKPLPDVRAEHFDDVVPGLALRVNAGGSKSWVLFYRNKGRQRRWTMGEYPTPLSLAAARRKARKALGRLADEGIDPADEKKHARAAGDTFQDLADAYLKDAKKRKRSWGEDDRILETELLPHWKHRRVEDITRRDVRALIEAIVERPAPVMANRVWALTSRIFNFAIANDWTETGNPAARIAKQPETSRDRVLTEDEIRQLWTTLDAARTLRRVNQDTGKPARRTPERIAPTIAAGLQVLLLTAQRPGEVFQMRWQDLDLTPTREWWTIPAEYSKNGEPHRVPLVPRAVELIGAAKALATRESKWVFAGIAGAHVAARAKKAAALLRSSGAIAFEFHRHDLRRTAATNMAAAGIRRETISHVLNHMDRGPRATRIYDRFEHDAEKRTALEAWARRLEAILTASEHDGRVLAFAT